MNRRQFLALSAFATGCGYHVGGKADLLPRSIQTIAIPPIANSTARYKLADRLTGALIREFHARTRYQILTQASQADAVLSGTILTYTAYPTIFDPATGRAAGVQLAVNMRIVLTERATGKVLFQRPAFEIRERYEVSTDQAQYFEESDQAVERISDDIARGVVSAVLSAF